MAGSVLRYMPEKAEIVLKGLLEVILVRAQKEKRKAVEKASTSLIIHK